MILNTIDKVYTHTIVVDKSKFICELHPIKSKQDAKQILSDIKEKHPKARHNCYAYIIKEEFVNSENQSDDGEPSKTAGLPMLEILRYENLINVLAVVTRYFGGTLLGTGGLIRAYSRSVKETVDLASIKQASLMLGYEIKVSYSHKNIVEHLLKQHSAFIKEIKFDTDVTLIFYTKEDNVINIIKEKINNQIKIIKLDSVYL